MMAVNQQLQIKQYKLKEDTRQRKIKNDEERIWNLKNRRG